MKNLCLLAAILAAMVAPASAQPQPAPKSGPACLEPINVYDFRTLPGNRSLIVIDKARRQYKVAFMGICPNLQYHLGLQFQAFGSQLSCMEKGDSVIVHDPVGPGRCIIQSIDAYTPDMAKADAAVASH